MATMDIFEGDAFSVIELTRALENIPFKPATLSGSPSTLMPVLYISRCSGPLQPR